MFNLKPTHLYFVSIIIPVYNDSKRLAKCLYALEQQTYPKDSFEIVVVDNRSEQDIEAIVSQFSQAQYAFEPTPGSYAARNQGISIAKGDILAFTDSDCLPSKDWLENGIKHLLSNPNCGMVAGAIELYYKQPNQPTVVELYDKFNFLRQETYVKSLNFGATANLFTFRRVFDAVGLFNEILKSSGDREWGQRVYAAGYPQIYAEDARVAHPARADLREITKKVIRITEGLFDVENPELKPLLPFIKEMVWDIKPPVKEVRKIFQNKEIGHLNKRLAYLFLFLRIRNEVAWTKARVYFSLKSASLKKHR